MIRGTTPTHYFNIPLDTSIIETARVTYAQNGKVILVKEGADCTLEDKQIRVTLSQEDTFCFAAKTNVEIQVRILTNDGRVLSSTIETVGVTKCLEDVVLK